jgi:hypothetical protein
MKRIVVLASVMILAASVTVFGQTQKPTTTATTTSTSTSTTHMTSTPNDKSHSEITFAELPKTAQDYLTKTYPGKKPEKVLKMTDSKGMTTYKADIAGMVLHFDNAGKLLGEAKKESKPATETKPATTPAQSTTPAKK